MGLALEAAQDRNQLETELRRLERYHLLVVDEVVYLPLERTAANLLFALVSRRYERSYQEGIWLPPPLLRPEPPAPPPPASLPLLAITPPELHDYAELCA